MNYYAEPKDLTLEQAKINTQIDDLIALRKALQTIERDFTEQMEAQYESIEERISFLSELADELYWETNHG